MAIPYTHIVELILDQNYRPLLNSGDTNNTQLVIEDLYSDFQQLKFTWDDFPAPSTPDNYNWSLYLIDENDAQSNVAGTATTSEVTFNIINRAQNSKDIAQVWMYDVANTTWSTLSKEITLKYRKMVE